MTCAVRVGKNLNLSLSFYFPLRSITEHHFLSLGCVCLFPVVMFLNPQTTYTLFL